MRILVGIMLISLALAVDSPAGQDVDALKEKGGLTAVIKERSEGALVEQSLAVEQARAAAQSRSEYGLELRPSMDESDVGAALRIYLPSRWSRSKLREQLALVTEEEQLRVAALEWRELMNVYRSFCEYRMLTRQLELYGNELEALEPTLQKADAAVKNNQLAVVDRAKLYSLYLGLVDSHEKIKAELLELQQKLHLLVGSQADLDAMAKTARIKMPVRMELEALLQRALENRADFRLHDVHARSASAAEAVARSEDGFRLKYIQPDVQVDHISGETTYGLAASFVLPWGKKNPDIAVYRQQRILSDAVTEWQRRLIKDRLQVLLKTADAYDAQVDERAGRIKPLLSTLTQDLQTLETGRLEDLRDVLLVRERILDASLQTTRTICRKERIAVDIAEEVGALED